MVVGVAPIQGSYRLLRPAHGPVPSRAARWADPSGRGSKGVA